MISANPMQYEADAVAGIGGGLAGGGGEVSPASSSGAAARLTAGVVEGSGGLWRLLCQELGLTDAQEGQVGPR